MLTASFNRFSLDMTEECVLSCAHQGACDDDVEYWAPKVSRPPECTPDVLAVELREYGAWSPEQLSDDNKNWLRVVWIAAGNIREEMEVR